MSRPSTSAEIVACKTCGQAHAMVSLTPGTAAFCVRCGSRIAAASRRSLQLTAALTLAALILYIPANVFPILHMEVYGASTQNTVWQGCTRLFQDGQWVIAGVVFLASMLIPLLKLAGLFTLVVTARFRWARGQRARTWIFRIIDAVGRWAMLDVFALAVLVSLVKLQKLATVMPGKGLFAFGCVVVLTLLASASFDPRLIWNPSEEGV